MSADNRFGPMLIVGLLAVFVGLAALVVTEIAASISLTEAFVTIVGAFAAIQGIRYGQAGRKTERTSVDLGDPERRSLVPTPGDEFDRELEYVRTGRRGGAVRRRDIQSRLRGTAATVLAIRSEHSREDALAALDDGRWPRDDPMAAAFLSNEPLPLTSRLRALVSRESKYALAIDRSIAAIEREWERPHERTHEGPREGFRSGGMTNEPGTAGAVGEADRHAGGERIVDRVRSRIDGADAVRSGVAGLGAVRSKIAGVVRRERS